MKTVIVMLVLAGIIVAGYFYITGRNKNEKSEEDYVQTEISKLLERDLDENYPVTAREVLKLYSRIVLQLHNGTVSEEEIDGLIGQLRKLYAIDLLAQNPLEMHLLELKTEINQYKENEQVISDYQVEKDSSAIKWSDAGVEYYRIIGAFAIKKKGIISRVYEEFILCREGKQWKVLGWQQVDGAEMDTN